MALIVKQFRYIETRPWSHDIRMYTKSAWSVKQFFYLKATAVYTYREAPWFEGRSYRVLLWNIPRFGNTDAEVKNANKSLTRKLDHTYINESLSCIITLCAIVRNWRVVTTWQEISNTLVWPAVERLTGSNFFLLHTYNFGILTRHLGNARRVVLSRVSVQGWTLPLTTLWSSVKVSTGRSSTLTRIVLMFNTRVLATSVSNLQ